MARKGITFTLLALLAAAALVLAFSGRTASPDGSTIVAQRGDVELTITSSGKLAASSYVNVGTQVSGQLKRLLKHEGESVNKGEIVAEIDDTVLKAQLLQARATLDNLRAQQAAQRAQVVLARQQAKRNEGLFEGGILSRAELEPFLAARTAAQASLQAIRAQIRQAEASVATAEANLAYTIIRAPISGVVVQANAREGQTLNAIQSVPEVMRIEDLATMTVVAQVSEADVTRLRVGQEAYFTVLGQPERRWFGTLRQIKPAPEVTNNVVFYHALFDVPNDGTLMTQMTAQVFFVLDRARNAVKVPLSALQNQRTRRAEVRVLKNGKAVVRPVTLRLANDIEAAIDSGLAAGEIIALPDAGTS